MAAGHPARERSFWRPTGAVTETRGTPAHGRRGPTEFQQPDQRSCDFAGAKPSGDRPKDSRRAERSRPRNSPLTCASSPIVPCPRGASLGRGPRVEFIQDGDLASRIPLHDVATLPALTSHDEGRLIGVEHAADPPRHAQRRSRRRSVAPAPVDCRVLAGKPRLLDFKGEPRSPDKRTKSGAGKT